MENQLAASYPGKPGWDDNVATFEMTIVANDLHGDYQLANGYGHNKAKDVLKNSAADHRMSGASLTFTRLLALKMGWNIVLVGMVQPIGLLQIPFHKRCTL